MTMPIAQRYLVMPLLTFVSFNPFVYSIIYM